MFNNDSREQLVAASNSNADALMSAARTGFTAVFNGAEIPLTNR